MTTSKKRKRDYEIDPLVVAATERGLVEIRDDQITYNLPTKKTYNWLDPEERVRAFTVAFLVLKKNYPLNRMRVEVTVPRRTPSDFADIVVYKDDQCREPYLVVENKSPGQNKTSRAQAIEQLFGNANSLRAEIALYDEFDESIFF